MGNYRCFSCEQNYCHHSVIYHDCCECKEPLCDNCAIPLDEEYEDFICPECHKKMEIKKMNKIVAIKECADGNETVGSMWLETKILTEKTPVGDIIIWGDSLSKVGKLMLTVSHEATDE